MNHIRPTHSATLIALPFLLLPAGIWLAFWAAEQARAGIPVVELWWVARWLLRALYIGGAFLGWRAGRPRWFYPWLGFAVYEAVAILLLPIFRLISGGNGTLTLFLGFALLALAFTPYFVAALWLGWQRAQRLLAAYAVFPHAALTLPLFFFVDAGRVSVISQPIGTASFLPAAAAAVVAVFFWRLSPPAFLRGQESLWRGSLLFGGVVLAHLLFLISLSFLEPFTGLGSLLLLIPLTCLGWLILSGPLLLPPLLQWLYRALKVEQGVAWLSAHGRQDNPVNSVYFGRYITAAGRGAKNLLHSVKSGYHPPKGDTPMSESTTTTAVPQTQQSVGPGLERAYKLSIVILTTLAVLVIALYVGRAAVYKIHQFERGLHLRGGRFLGVQMPGWHAQVPLVDTVIIVKVNERLGYVERIPAMTSDNVTMDVSLQYTYRVINPERFALDVDDPERIVFEFVQGRLRDVINTKAMTAVMNQRTTMNLEIMQTLKEKEDQYGVEFMTVQIQSASPPAEVLTAIKDRMVAVQRQGQAEAEATQQRTVADAQFYAAQKQADAQAYRITTTAAAEAEKIQLTTVAQQLAVRAILSELEGKGALAEKYIEYLIAAELKENSKWILGNGAAAPIVDLRASVGE